jgi:hypothetical protein
MSMSHSVGLMDVVVFVALGFSAAFTVAWALSPALREWIERPKYRFQENLRNFDKEARR